MGDLFGVPIGPAGVCGLQHRTAAALEPVAAEAQARVAGEPANIDETGWRQARTRVWLWVAATATLTVFLIRPSRGRKVLGEFVPGELGVLTTDRYGAYAYLDPGRRQVCWSHLRRDFQAMIDRADAGSAGTCSNTPTSCSRSGGGSATARSRGRRSRPKCWRGSGSRWQVC